MLMFMLQFVMLHSVMLHFVRSHSVMPQFVIPQSMLSLPDNVVSFKRQAAKCLTRRSAN